MTSVVGPAKMPNILGCNFSNLGTFSLSFYKLNIFGIWNLRQTKQDILKCCLWLWKMFMLFWCLKGKWIKRFSALRKKCKQIKCKPVKKPFSSETTHIEHKETHHKYGEWQQIQKGEKLCRPMQISRGHKNLIHICSLLLETHWWLLISSDFSK